MLPLVHHGWSVYVPVNSGSLARGSISKRPTPRENHMHQIRPSPPPYVVVLVEVHERH